LKTRKEISERIVLLANCVFDKRKIFLLLSEMLPTGTFSNMGGLNLSS